MDKGEAINVMYLEFNKGSDTVPHDSLISKLMKYGLDRIFVNTTS